MPLACTRRAKERTPSGAQAPTPRRERKGLAVKYRSHLTPQRVMANGGLPWRLVRCYCTVREDMCLSPNCEMLVYHGPDGEQHEQRKRQVTKVTTVQEHDCVDARHF